MGVEDEVKANSVKAMAAAMEGLNVKQDEKTEDKQVAVEKETAKEGEESEKGKSGQKRSYRKDRPVSRLTPEEKKRLDDERRKKYLEEQAKKPVLEKAQKGHVKWYSLRNRYGFIERDEEGKKDIFVHQMAISESPMERTFMRTLKDGEPVEFDIVEGKQGPEASNVTGPEGGKVEGVKFFFWRPFRGRFASRKSSTSKSRGSTAGRGRRPVSGTDRRRSKQSEAENEKSGAEDAEKAVKDTKKGNRKANNHRRLRKNSRRQRKETGGEAKDNNKETKGDEIEASKNVSNASGDAEPASLGNGQLVETHV